jgi:hypothetical protein
MPPKKKQQAQQNTLLAMWSKPKNVHRNVEDSEEIDDDHATDAAES